jgi:hypothetical protein
MEVLTEIARHAAHREFERQQLSGFSSHRRIISRYLLIMSTRSRASEFESFRAFTNCEYLKDAPPKMAVPTAMGAMFASISRPGCSASARS